MKRVAITAAILLMAAPAFASIQERVEAQFPIQLVFTQNRLTTGQVRAISACKLRFYLKAGMTNAEANAAIDDGYTRFFSCLKNKGKIGRNPNS